MSTVVSKLTDTQLQAIVIIERVCSILSLLGCAVIIITFLTSSAFGKAINRLVFYAAIGNVMTNVATLIARSAIHNLTGGFCQFQAFLIQMFMASDAYWTTAMAFNVYLTFYYKFDSEKLRTMEKWYFLVCWGLPFIPAFIYIWIADSDGARMYGDASLWCWISTSFDVMRIATFYAPVWVAVTIAIVIYVRAGREIYRKHKQLRNFSSMTDPGLSTIDYTKTTEVHVTHEDVNPSPAIPPKTYPVELGSRSDSHRQQRYESGANYSVTVSASINPKRESLPVIPVSEAPALRYQQEANNAAWSYTKIAFLFFSAMLITWIPSTANRVYSVVHPGDISVPLTFASAFVLPLQGFWNAIIYAMTSRAAFGVFFDSIFRRRSPSMELFGGTGGFGSGKKRLGSIGGNSPESESMTELANRPTTKERIQEDNNGEM